MGYDIRQQLIAEEKTVPHVYEDSEGYLTIGVGRLVDRRKNGGLRQVEIDFMLSNDIDECVGKLRNAMPWYDTLNEPRKGVLIGMCFQLGFDGLMRFKDTLAQMMVGNHEGAAQRMLQSLWARQTPARAKRMAEQWRTGVWQKKTD